MKIERGYDIIVFQIRSASPIPEAKEVILLLNHDLTVGKPSAVLWKFCLPLFGSVIFQQLYNIADSFVAGKFVGEDALAAVGNGYEITLIFLAFAFGCNIGCSVIVGQLFGAKRYGDLKTAVYTTLIAVGVLCALLMALGLLFCRQLLVLIHTPAELIDASLLYLRIYIWGLPFVFYYNVATGIFSALGDSRTPFRFLAASSLSNIGMDILFVTAFRMGVAGVAWATFLCQGVSCVLAVGFVLLRLRKIPVEGRVRPFSWSLLGRIARVAVPSTFQQSFISVGNIVVQGVINSFGVAAMAGYSASIKLNNLVITSFFTFGNGVSNFTAQNIGAGRRDRLRPGFLAGLRMVLILCVPVIILYLAGGAWLVRIFMEDGSGDALRIGVRFLTVVSPFYFLVVLKIIADGVLRGAGKMIPFMVSTFSDLILRVVLSILLSRHFGITGVWMSWPIGWVVGAAFALSFFLFLTRKKPQTDP